MRPTGSDLHLTYCTNIHPANGRQEVLARLKTHSLALKRRLSPDEPFGIGLRLSGQESSEFLQNGRMDALKAFLDDEGLYVFTLNGFPHGPFHGQPVKQLVHDPDWRSGGRVAYTLRLIEILTRLLPENAEGSISTSPLSYKGWVDARDATTWKTLTRNIVRVAEELVRVYRETGKLIHLDLEPEPDGLLESTADVLRFFEDWLTGFGARLLAGSVGVSVERAVALLLRHIRVCFDTCHVAMAFEKPKEALAALHRAGVRVGKVQVSSALRILPEADLTGLTDSLSPFAESTYLHQVRGRDANGHLIRYPDLPQAIPHIAASDGTEWRIHFHVPVFLESYSALYSTQREIRQTFDALKHRDFTRHLEIETYTWEVLPPELKLDLTDSIAREYEWSLRELL